VDLVFKARRVITAAGEVARSIGVRDGKVAAIEPLEADLDAERIVELGADVVLLPGLVDCHTHLAFGGWRQDEFGNEGSGTKLS
jgi:allantoinase